MVSDTRSSDFNTNYSYFAYDTFGRITAITKPGDTSTFPTVEYEYKLAVEHAGTNLVNFIETRQLDRTPDGAGSTESGERADSFAYFSQTARRGAGTGGICNSPIIRDADIDSSFIEAYVRNTGKYAGLYRITCTLTWSAKQFGGATPRSYSAWQAQGNILGTSTASHATTSDLNSSRNLRMRITADVCLKPGAAPFRLYRLAPAVSLTNVAPGEGFDENAAGTCQFMFLMCCGK